MPTGIAGLDAILGGGLFQAGLTIIQGQTGAGKTILGNQLCHNHARSGGRALYVTMLAETHSRMLQHMGSMRFFEPGCIPDGVFYISGFPVLESGGLRAFAKLLWEEVRRTQATLLVLDGLMNVELQAGSELAFKKFIHELQSQATLADCGMVLLTSSGGESVPPSVEHTLVDAVIEMRNRLYGWRAERDLEVLKRRGDEFIRGRHAFTITGAGVQVFPRFEALLSPPMDQPPDPARIPSGIPALDDMLHGGIPLGSTTLLTGPAGSGKTTLALQFLGQCSPDQPGVLLSTSESPAAVRAKAGALGLPASGLMDGGHIGLVWSPGTAGMLDETAGCLLAEVERRGACRLVVDGIQGLVRLAPDPDRMLHVLAALRLGMRARGVTTLLTAEQDGPGLPLPGMPDLSGVAENLVALRLRDRRGPVVRTIQVRKARDTGVDTRPRVFDLGEGGLHVLPPDPARD